METNLDTLGHIQEITGLTPRELYLLVVAQNGVAASARAAGAFFAGNLAMSMHAAGEVSFRERERFGGDLNFPENDTADTPYEYYEMAEKIAKMRDDKAAFLEGFAAGFWAACEDAERSRAR
jgi:hypothetical protein